ncbi:MAG: GFA family protein [Pseudomonadota bacterium]
MITGRCYCGGARVTSPAPVQTVAYCHCGDCRRVTGAPVTAFAAVARDSVQFAGKVTKASHSEGVTRWFCHACGSPLLAEFAYLPDQSYLPLGILDQAPDLTPSLHCYAEAGMPWLKIDDDLERTTDSGAATLQAAADV